MSRMRGDDREPDSMFSYIWVEQRAPADHPLRAIRVLVDGVLDDMSPTTAFTKTGCSITTSPGFFRRLVERAQPLMSDEHFTVDGTLIEAWASQKSFQRKDGGPDDDRRNFRGQERKSDTHASTTDPDARLYRKSNTAESRLAYVGHLLIENRHGLRQCDRWPHDATSRVNHESARPAARRTGVSIARYIKRTMS
jgi:hypothetical protein